MAVPDRTAEQRRTASQRAVLARRRRADVATRLKTGGLSVPDLLTLAQTDEAVAAMRVSAVLASLPRMGPRRSADAMARLRVSPSRRLRGLGSAQRRALIDLVGSAATAPSPSDDGPDDLSPDEAGPDNVSPSDLSPDDVGPNPPARPAG